MVVVDLCVADVLSEGNAGDGALAMLEIRVSGNGHRVRQRVTNMACEATVSSH